MKLNPQIALEFGRKLEPPEHSPIPLKDKVASRDIELHRKSKELEAVFITQLMKAMEKTIPEGMLGSNHSLPGMLFSGVMGDALAGSGGIGLSDMIYNSLKENPQAGGQNELNTEAFLQALDAGALKVEPGEES